MLFDEPTAGSTDHGREIGNLILELKEKRNKAIGDTSICMDILCTTIAYFRFSLSSESDCRFAGRDRSSPAVGSSKSTIPGRVRALAPVPLVSACRPISPKHLHVVLSIPTLAAIPGRAGLFLATAPACLRKDSTFSSIVSESYMPHAETGIQSSSALGSTDSDRARRFPCRQRIEPDRLAVIG